MCARKLDEIRFARTCIEPRLAELAAPNLNDIDIDELERIDDDLETAIRSGDVGAYLRGNFRFHFNLYAASGARILERVAMSLWLQVGPSLRIVCSTFGTSDLPDMHEETIAALRRRDRHLVANTIESDILQGMELIRQQLFSD